MLLFLMREMRDLKNKLSPGVNAFRTYTYLIIGWQFLNTPANDIVAFSTTPSEGTESGCRSTSTTCSS